MHRQFILAAHRGDTDLVAAMIEDGVDVACVNDRGDTPLHMAVAGEHVRIVVALLDAEADCRARDVLGRCCLHVAAETGNDEIMKLLLRKAKGDKKAVNAPARGNCTPLHLAAMLNHATVAHRLLIAGAGLEMADVKGRTPVHHAADAGSIDVINLLGEVGIRVLVDFVRSMDCFYYCIHALANTHAHIHSHASSYMHTHTYRTATKNDADVNRQDLAGSTALHMAVAQSQLGSVRALLGLAANPSLRDAAGRNPLDVAAALSSDQREGIMDALVSFGADQDIEQYHRSIAFQATEVNLPSPDREAELAEKTRAVPTAGQGWDEHHRSWNDGTSAVSQGHDQESSNNMGWEQLLDDASGCYYWWNSFTGETQWVVM